MRTPLFVVITILVFVIVGACVMLVVYKVEVNAPVPEQIACTMDAKICPDGSAVGRVAPNCDFAVCPGLTPSPIDAVEKTTSIIGGIAITPLSVAEDSRCPVDVTCVWAGTVRLKAVLATAEKSEEVILILGTPSIFAGKQVTLENVSPAPHSKKSIAQAEYRFVFSVVPEVSSSTGTLSGTMTIGPVCPVERVDQPCKPTPEMFAARKIFVYQSDKKTVVTTIIPSGDGSFSIQLPVGAYYVDMPNQRIGGVSGLPVTLKIEKGKSVTLTVDVDTGIR